MTAVGRTKIDASIVTYHTADDELRTCLDALLASPGIRIVHIIDNSSDGATEKLATQYAPRVTYTPHPNTGYGDAHNVALRRTLGTGTPYHLVINSDVYFTAGTLERCLAYMDAHPEAGQLIPHTIFPDGHEQHVCHPLPTPLDMLMRGFLPQRWLASRRRRYDLIDRDPAQVINPPYHHGCFMLLRTEALRTAGLFDPRYFMYPEDIDLTRRIHRHSHTVYYPGATIVHAHRAESKTSWRMRKIHIINMLKYFHKWGFWFDTERRKFNRQLMHEIQEQKNAK
ncbi:MAG TPA: glycosyl transferase family 2 [Porphyromonadaceae bacterium]|nr:glycosyl transferase family 2 [Porphyromonadaceae bacterium]